MTWRTHAKIVGRVYAVKDSCQNCRSSLWCEGLRPKLSAAFMTWKTPAKIVGRICDVKDSCQNCRPCSWREGFMPKCRPRSWSEGHRLSAKNSSSHSHVFTTDWIVNQTNIGTVSKATLGRLLRDGWNVYGLFRAHGYHLELNCSQLSNVDL